MPDFSVILQSPQVRAIVQENLLERAFHDALYPRLLFRQEVTPVPWPAGVGDTMVFTAPGLMPVDARPLVPGQDPEPDTYPLEQWVAQIQQYAKSIDTNMPTSMVAIANLFLRNAQQIGLQAGQTLNRIVRNKMYAAALSGWGVITGAASTTNTISVARLNGFTRARNPSITGASTVQFQFVSATNPLSVVLFDNGAQVSNTVVGFNPTTPGDEMGPGTLTLGTNVTNVAARAYIVSADATSLQRVGGGNSVNDVGSTDIPTLADIRAAVANFWSQNVPEQPDGRFHCHLDPSSQTQIFADSEFQRLLTALPDYFIYKQFALGELLNTVFFRNSECPQPSTVVGGLTASYDARDPFPGELYSNGNASTGVPIHRMLLTAQGGIMEYYSDLSALLTEAGVTGKIGEPSITNNGIEVFTERVQLIIRAPLNRLQDMVSTSWKFIADWPTRTDAATGSPARYKRFQVIEGGQ